MAEETLKDIQPRPGEPTEVAPKAKEGINKMADAFRQLTKEDLPQKPKPEPPPELPKESEPAPEPAPEPPKSKPEPSPEPSQAPEPPKASEAARENFQRLSEKARKLEAELTLAREGSKRAKELEEKFKEIEPRLKKAELLEKRYELENSPEFNQHFQVRIDAAKEDALDAVPPDVHDKVKDILENSTGRHRDAQIKAIISDMDDDYGKQTLIASYNTLKSVQRERDVELSNARLETSYDKLAELRKQAQLSEQQHAAVVREQFFNALKSDIEPELEKVETAQDVTKKFRSLINGEASAEDYADVIKHAAKGYRLKGEVEAKDALIAKLQAQVEELSATNPKVGLTTRNTTTHQKGDDRSIAKSIGDKFRAGLGQ